MHLKKYSFFLNENIYQNFSFVKDYCQIQKTRTDQLLKTAGVTSSIPSKM